MSVLVNAPEELRTAFTPVRTDRLLLRAVCPGDVDAVFAIHGDPRVIGFGGLTRQLFCERQVLNMYYRFEPAAWGYGYATEMATAALALARSWMPELPVIVRTRPGNEAAQAVAQKLHLARAPNLDDHLLTYVSDWDLPR
jgi:RimJ/RimL family protein N-acetyltransferase